jgi:ABC-2 type transport system permease protein
MSATPASVTIAGPHVTMAGVVRSEFVKLFGLRSTWWLVGVGLVAPTLFAAAQTINRGAETPAEGILDAASQSTGSALFSVLVVMIVLGVLAVSAEYETRSITVTMSAVPSRTPVVIAKTLVVFAVGFLLGFIATLLAYVAGVLIRADGDLILDGFAFRAILGAAFYFACIGVVSLSFGFLIRSTIGSVAAVLAFLFLLPGLIHGVPIEAVMFIADTIPGASAAPLYSAEPDPGGWGVLGAAIWSAAWALVLVVAAAFVTRRRDL